MPKQVMKNENIQTLPSRLRAQLKKKKKTEKKITIRNLEQR